MNAFRINDGYSKNTEPINTTLEQIRENPYQFNGKRVVFDAEVNFIVNDTNIHGMSLQLNQAPQNGNRSGIIAKDHNGVVIPASTREYQTPRNEMIRLESRVVALPRQNSKPEVSFRDVKLLARK